MTEILLPLLTLATLATGFAVLVRFARADTFAGPGLGHRDPDPLRQVADRPRRDQRIVMRLPEDVRPATNESHARIRTA